MLPLRLPQSPSTTSVHLIHATATHLRRDSVYTDLSGDLADWTDQAAPIRPQALKALKAHSTPNAIRSPPPPPSFPFRTRRTPPLERPHIPTSRSLPDILSLSTPSLLSAGPAGYYYTPTSSRAPGFESFRDDHGIVYQAHRRPFVALLVRLKGRPDQYAKRTDESVTFRNKIVGSLKRKKDRVKGWVGRRG
jgi:hypothetical protein